MQSLRLVQWLFVSYSYHLAVALPSLQRQELGKPVREETAEVALDNYAQGAAVHYDQRQSGKYNIHISVKDVAIIEMSPNEIEDESFDEEDYYYDDDDLTVKPIFTTASSAHQTAAIQATTTTGVVESEVLDSMTGVAPATDANNGGPTQSNATATRKTASVIILETSTRTNNNNSGNNSMDTAASVLTMKTTPDGQQQQQQLQDNKNAVPVPAAVRSFGLDGNSRIYKLQMRRGYAPKSGARSTGRRRPCRALNGNTACRANSGPSASSMLRRIFSTLLSSLPLATDGHDEIERV